MSWNCQECTKANYDSVDTCAWCGTRAKAAPSPPARCSASLGRGEQCCSYEGHPGEHLLRDKAPEPTPAPEFVKSDSGKLPHDQRCEKVTRPRGFRHGEEYRCVFVAGHIGRCAFTTSSEERCLEEGLSSKCSLPKGHTGGHYSGAFVPAHPEALAQSTERTGDFVKADMGKLPHELLPFVALEQVSAVLAFGAKKYAAHRWRKIDKRSRYFSATLRHLFAYAKGEDKDPESGLPHLAHAACSVLFLLEASVSGLGEDDRPRDGKA